MFPLLVLILILLYGCKQSSRREVPPSEDSRLTWAQVRDADSSVVILHYYRDLAEPLYVTLSRSGTSYHASWVRWKPVVSTTPFQLPDPEPLDSGSAAITSTVWSRAIMPVLSVGLYSPPRTQPRDTTYHPFGPSTSLKLEVRIGDQRWSHKEGYFGKVPLNSRMLPPTCGLVRVAASPPLPVCFDSAT